MNEVVVVAQGPPSSTAGDAAGEVSMPVLSLATGTNVFQLRGGGVGGAPAGCVASVQGGMRVAACASAKASRKTGSAVYIWEWGREQPVVRSYPPTRISCLLKQPAPDSSFPLLVAGCHNGSVLAWELCTGRLLASWKAHYRGVSALCVSPDASMIVSGGEDGVVHVWPLVAALRSATSSSGPAGHVGTTRSLHSWSHHTMPVSGLASGGHGSGGGGLIVSASLDGTVRLYSLAQGSLLRTFTFAAAVSSIALDPSEMCVYVGCSDGGVMRAILNVRVASGADATSLGTSARGEGGNNAVEGVTAMRGAMHKRFVSALALNASGNTLISASDDGILHFFDTISLQSTRTMTFSSSITNLFITSLRHDLLLSRQRSGPGSAHASNSGNATKYSSTTVPLPPIAPLAKYVQSLPLDLKSWEDTYIYVAPHRRRDSRQEKTYRACIDDDEDMDDCMHPFMTSADILERFACGAPNGVGESGGDAEQEVRPADDSEL